MADQEPPEPKKNGFLVLTLKENQGFSIGDDVICWIRKTHSGRVQVAVKAPKPMPIIKLEPDDT
jgi:sRNA-binding carbon storage regulator CsrA